MGIVIENEFTVAATPDDTYALMTDVERVAPCIPGATITGKREDGAYDALVTHVISVTFLMAHETGEVVPGDDMDGSRVRWVTVDEIESERLRLVPPLDQPWLRQRTIDLYRLWQPAPDVHLQEPLSGSGWNKKDV